MFYSGKAMLALLFLFALLPKVLIADNDWIYERNKRIYCEYPICHFNINNDNHFSPLIPAKYITKAKWLGDYHYMYLIFNKPKENDQKNFFLELNDVKSGETLISNGDCYQLELDKNVQYELRIYKTYEKDALVQLKFIGLNPSFFMSVKIKFPLDIDIYAYSIKLDRGNSLWKKQQQGLIEYLEKYQQNLVKEEEIKKEASDKIKKILKIILRKELDIGVSEIYNLATYIIPTNFAIFTVSIRYSLGDSTERYFNDKEIIISDSFYVKGVLMSKKNSLDFLGDNVDVTNEIKNLIDIYNGGIENLIYGLEFGTDSYSLTVSTCYNCRYVNYIFRFYIAENSNIYLEIDLQIEFINNNLFKPIESHIEYFKEAFKQSFEDFKNDEVFWTSVKIGMGIGLLPVLGGAFKGIGQGIGILYPAIEKVLS